ncbi:DUF4097 family beta strand repeat-containing protein [Paenibacillus sp. S-38]|uniref:DUF4097 family beta strand repeat-containing protein n=1 Tax=Paenibacillus sp. S-38 TaxID=3416710 RepID=UPI003CEF08D8
MKRNVKGGLLLAVGLLLLTMAVTKEGWASIPVSFSMNTEEVRMEESTKASSIKSIQVDSGSTDVRIVPGSTDEIRTRLEGRASSDYAERLRLEVKPEGEKLHIKAVESDEIHLGLNLTHLELIVELPEKAWESVAIRTRSGNLELAELKGAKVEAEAGSGDIEASKIKAAQLKLLTTSGNIRSEEFEGENLVFKAGTGDVVLVNGQSEVDGSTGSGTITVQTEALQQNADLSTGSGDVIVESARQPSSLAVDYNSGSGTGEIQWQGITYQDKSEDGERIKGVFGAGEAHLKVRTTSGDFKLLQN